MTTASLTTLRASVRQLGDYEASTVFTDAFLDEWINRGIEEYHEFLLDSWEGYYDKATDALVTVAGVQEVALPTDFLRLRLVQRKLATDSYTELRRVTLVDISRYGGRGAPRGYALHGESQAVAQVAAAKAFLALDPLTAGNADSVIEAKAAGPEGNDLTIQLIAGSAVDDGELNETGWPAITFAFKTGATTVADFEAAITASTFLAVKTPGPVTPGNPAADTFAANDTLAATNLAGGAHGGGLPGRIRLWPVPDGVYTLRLTYAPVAQQLVAGADTIDLLPGGDRFVIYAALFELDEREGRPVADRQVQIDRAKARIKASAKQRNTGEPEYLMPRSSGRWDEDD